MENIIYKKEGNIATITINRPKALNAFNSQTIEELHEALQMAEEDQQVRCVVINSSVVKAFTVGGDIKEEITKTGFTAYEFALLGKKCIESIYNHRVPVISAINGYALGAGMEIILASDITVAATNAKIGLPTIKLGTIPGWGSTVMLERAVGISRAKELLYTGRTLDGEESLKLGLVEFVVEEDALMEKTYELASEIAQKAPIAMQSMKKAINAGAESDLERAYVIETGLFARCYGTNDRLEAMSAFLEKREPREFGGN